MTIAWAAAVFAMSEAVALLLFWLVRKGLGPKGDTKPASSPVLRGALERLVLFVGLLAGYPQIIIAFGALKLGTRLHDETECKISNSYFLVGNLLSILLAMVAAAGTEHLWQCPPL